MIELDIITLISLLFMMFGLGIAVAFPLPNILNNMRIKGRIKKGMMFFHFIGDNYGFKSKWIKSTPEITFEDKLYKPNNKFVVNKNRIPHMFFYEGDSRPIDMLKRGLDEKIHPDIMSKAMVLANLTGGIVKPMDNKIMFYAIIGCLALSGLGLAISFNMSSSGVICSNLGALVQGVHP